MATPKLRFKEFEGDWSTNKIEEISIVTSGGTPSRNVSDYWNGDIPWVTTSLVDFNVINEAEEFITQVGLDNSSAKLFHKDTILMAMYGQGITRGKVAILGIDATTNQACAAIKLKNGFETKFIFQNLMNRYEEIRDLSNEGGQKNLSAGIIKEILISFPEKEEQTKIASFLSAVDEKISQLTQKHALLSQYKQGMMQKLFSQQLRFKADDGSEFGEWENKTLGEVGENIIGLTYSPTDVTNDSTGILVLRSSNIKEGRLDKSDQVRVNKKIKDKIIIQPNDILICTRNGSQRLIGKSVIINDDEIMTFGAFMSVYRSHYNRFIAYLMQTPWFFEQVQMNLGARINQITTGTLNEFTFDFPCLEEQTKIANFLSAIDQKIEVVVQQIEQAKQWKKGLLQQMFV